MPCPVCGSRLFRSFASAPEISREIRRRENFVHSRLNWSASPTELKDLTDFMHGFAAPLETCTNCGLMVRSEKSTRNTDSYSEDPNDTGIMEAVFPRYVEAFRNKAPGFRDLLRPNSDVLEVGSHLGAFLQTAEEWNWNPIGLDVGTDTAEFATRRGLTVHRNTMEQAPLRAGSYHGIFIWNCFEQLTDPGPTLMAAHRALRRNGLITLRVPNADFYRHMRRHTSALAWNNLLGFPYLYGYTAALISQLVGRFGFRHVKTFDTELVTLPFPELTGRIHREQSAISRSVAEWSMGREPHQHTPNGPWIEMVFRRVEESVRPEVPKAEARFLPRAA